MKASMPGLSLRPYADGDAAGLRPRPPESGEGLPAPDAMIAALTGLKRTVRDRGSGRTVCVYGAVSSFGTAAMWSFMDASAARWPLALCRGLKAFVRELLVTHHRVECLVLTVNPASRAWLERVAGFECEGLLRACGPDRRDRYIMARVRNFGTQGGYLC